MRSRVTPTPRRRMPRCARNSGRSAERCVDWLAQVVDLARARSGRLLCSAKANVCARRSIGAAHGTERGRRACFPVFAQNAPRDLRRTLRCPALRVPRNPRLGRTQQIVRTWRRRAGFKGRLAPVNGCRFVQRHSIDGFAIDRRHFCPMLEGVRVHDRPDACVVGGIKRREKAEFSGVCQRTIASTMSL